MESGKTPQTDIDPNYPVFAKMDYAGEQTAVIPDKHEVVVRDDLEVIDPKASVFADMGDLAVEGARKANKDPEAEPNPAASTLAVGQLAAANS